MPLNSHSILSSTDQPAEESLIDRRRELADLLGVSPTHATGSSGAWPVRIIGRYLDLPLDDWATGQEVA